ncbi:MAG: PAS domain-containing protein [Alphaproteobacteria bacterium]|nr:PAS domain-containing protein [Alphaproteobacteria bacterium]
MAIVDTNDRIAGRNRSPEQFVGRAITPSLAEKLHANVSGHFVSLNQEGKEVFTAFVRSEKTGWVIAIGVPMSDVQTAIREKGVVILGAFAVVLLIIGILATPIGRRILRDRLAEREIAERLEALVTERTARLAEAEARFRSMADNVPGVIFQRIMHADGGTNISYVSAAVQEIFGLEPREIVDDPAGWMHALPEDYKATLVSSMASLQPFTWLGRECARDGRDIWLQIRGRPRRLENGDTIFDCVAFDITELVRAQDALRESEERIRSITANLPGGIFRRVLHPDGRITYPFTTGGVVRWYGMDTTALERDSSLFIETLHPDDRNRWFSEVRASAKSLAPFDFEYRMKDPSGRYHWIRAIAQTHRLDTGEVVWDGVTLDVTAQKEAEIARRDVEGRFMRLVRNIPGMVFDRVQRPDGRVEYPFIAGQLVESLGIPPPGHPDRATAIGAMTHPDDRAEWLRRYEDSARDMSVVDGARRLMTPSGIRWFRNIAVPRRMEDGSIVWEGIGLDVTTEREAEARLIQAEKLSTLGTLASGITHELNQPLSIIRMAADACLILMEDGPLDPAHTKQQLETISGQCERMADIINHMRIFSRRDDSGEVKQIDPSVSVRAAVRFLAEQIRLAGIELSTRIPETCRAIRGHPVGLEQVVVNLIGNAKDVIEERHVSPGRIEVAVEEDADWAETRIMVTDNGGGIPADVLPKLFEPFFTTKIAGKGTGLGLAIVQSIVTTMGGTIAAANVAGGARFTVTLPWCPPP